MAFGSVPVTLACCIIDTTLLCRTAGSIGSGGGGSHGREQQPQVTTDSGALLASCQPHHFTHLVSPADKFARSMKQLMALASGAALVSDSWLEACHTAGESQLINSPPTAGLAQWAGCLTAARADPTHPATHAHAQHNCGAANTL